MTARKFKTKITSDEVIAEIDWFLSCGVHPLQIASQLGKTAAALAKVGQRAGRKDIAAMYAAVDSSRRREAA